MNVESLKIFSSWFWRTLFLFSFTFWYDICPMQWYQISVDIITLSPFLRWQEISILLQEKASSSHMSTVRPAVHSVWSKHPFKGFFSTICLATDTVYVHHDYLGLWWTNEHTLSQFARQNVISKQQKDWRMKDCLKNLGYPIKLRTSLVESFFQRTYGQPLHTPRFALGEWYLRHGSPIDTIGRVHRWEASRGIRSLSLHKWLLLVGQDACTEEGRIWGGILWVSRYTVLGSLTTVGEKRQVET